MASIQARKDGGIGAWWPALAVALPALVLALAGEDARLLLRWERASLAAGEYWRLVSGHFVHLGWSHLGLNLAGLGLVWLLVGRRFGAPAWLVIIAATLAGIDLGFWYLEPQLAWYVGLSGLLHGVLAAGVLAGIRQAPSESLVLGLGLAAKLVYESAVGPLPGSEATAGGAVIVSAHLYGAVAGGLCAVLVLISVGRLRAI